MQRLTWFGLMLIFTRNVTKKILKFYYENKDITNVSRKHFHKTQIPNPKNTSKKRSEILMLVCPRPKSCVEGYHLCVAT